MPAGNTAKRGLVAHPTKIATCCYCSSRTVLTLDRGRHELSCGSCGAPLHRMKMLPVTPEPARPGKTHQPAFAKIRRPKSLPAHKRRKKKSFLRYMAEEAFDWVEDIFD
jgi:hypothetical protein